MEVASRDAADGLRREKDRKRFWELLEPHGIFVEISGKYRDFPFRYDPRKIRYILRNLVSNSLKYRRRRVGVSIRGEMDLLVSVEDDGPGIPQREQNSVFEHFVRLNGKEYPDAPGLGLGLAGVKALVEAMGATISPVSREGTGTRFSVGIPSLP